MRTLLATLVLLTGSWASAADDKPRVAVFPITGDAAEATRERAGYSLRTKLDRTGQFDVIDGPKMQEIAAESDRPITFASDPAQIRELAQLVDAQVVLWGEASGQQLRMNILDLRSPAAPVQIVRPTTRPTDLRFAVEQVLEQIEDVGRFEHPIEQLVWEDELSAKLWRENPNLVGNGSFEAPGAWTGIYRSEQYPAGISQDMPPRDKVAIVKGAGDGAALVLNLSQECAETNGLAALSDPFTIEPATRYRLQFRYKSDGPLPHIFVKGYTRYASPTGEMMDREIYRRQLPLLKATGGQWITITDDFNPQHVSLPVQNLRVDLYAYLHPGTVIFDDVIVKAVGPQTRDAKDKAIKPAARRGQ